MPLTTAAGAASLIKDIDSLNKAFQLAVEVENYTQHPLKKVAGFPFFPKPDSATKVRAQCGQSLLTTEGGKIGQYAPDSVIPAAESSTSTDVDVWDCHGVGSDGNIGCIMYEITDDLRLLVAWFMGGGHKNRRALIIGDLGTDAVSYWKDGATLATTVGGTCTFGSVWKDYTEDCSVKSDVYTASAGIGGDEQDIALTVQVRQAGHQPEFLDSTDR